jgi:sulfite reductase (NADPH) flavoprotein alpha-component
MIGPGTGIAPFRAFLQHRQKHGHTGRNWLFFGDQHAATDFLYSEEFTAAHKSGHLHKLSTAFSRDQAEKIYVQHRMREEGAELWKWLQNGAYFYVCGDAKRMAKDVHAALLEITAQHGGKTPEQAEEYISVTLSKTEKRYLKDVY